MRITERGVLIAATALLFAAGTVFVITGEAVLQSGSGGWAFLLWAPGFGLCGAIVTRRYPRHAVGRLLLWAGLSSGLLAAWFFGALGGQFGALGEAVGSVLWLFPFMLVFAAIARFPNGAWSSPWAARFLWTFVVALGVQVPLGYIDRSDIVDHSAIEMGFDSIVEIGLILNDAGDDQPPPAEASNLDREMDALVRMDATKKDQVITCAFLEWVELEVDAVIDGGQIGQPGGAVSIADRDIVAAPIFFINRHDLG